MEIKAQLKFMHIAPRKVRLVADLIRGMDVKRALLELEHLPKRSAGPLLKLLRSAIANAKHNFQLSEEGFYVKKLMVNQGTVLKRFEPRAFGRAAPVRRRSSHIMLVLDSKSERPKVKKGRIKEGPVVRDVTVEDVGGETGTAFKAERSAAEAGKRLKSPEFVRRVFRRKAI